MAAGNLGDDEKYTNAIKAGVLLDWTKDGLLNEYGKNILAYPKAIEKAKTNFGNGSSVYGLGHAVSTMPATSPSEGNYQDILDPNKRLNHTMMQIKWAL